MSSNTKIKTQTFSNGLYGTTTTNKNGTTYNPSDFEKNLINMTNNWIPQYMQQLVQPTYDSNVFKAQTEQRNRLANQAFENNLINPLASRGLTRGSNVNQMSNQFANKLADLENDAMANEDTRIANVLSNLFKYYQVPYSMMSTPSGCNNGSLSNSQSSTGQALGSLAGAGLGAYFGGPTGASVGSSVGGQIGGLFD